MIKKLKNKREGGFILLMSSIVISVILVAIVFSISFGGFFTRFDLLDGYNKEASLGLAQACGEIAVLKKMQNPFYGGDESVVVGSDTCRILPIEIYDNGRRAEIKTTATINGALSNVQVTYDCPNRLVTRRRELASF
jgi:hypothetical protein